MEFRPFDDEYVERLRAGDEQTEQHFASYFGQLIEIHLRSRISSREDREDIRQDTFIRFFRLMRSDSGIRQPDRLGALVLAICKNTTLEFMRKHTTESIEAIPEPPDPGLSPFSIWMRKLRRALFERVLKNLTERDRRLLQQVYWEERDKDEICRIEGVSRDYLRLLLLRARQAFKDEYLKQSGRDPNQGHLA
jgi:RNA polymerase sigma-70 factor (ECF subfamily)